MNGLSPLVLGVASVAAVASTADAQCVVTADGSGVQCETLLAGQTIDAGTVCVEIVGSSLVVTYATTGCWELTEAHLWVGTNVADMPQTRRGNPKIGNFPHSSGDLTGSTGHSFSVPLDQLFSCPGEDHVVFVAAHAAVRCDNGDGTYETETGWIDGDRFVERGSWATYSSTTLACDCDSPPPPSGDCETAFALGTVGGADYSTCFLDLDMDGDGDGDFNRWGWTNLIGPGSYSFPIYAGAGQCDTSKGTLVGNLVVVYDNEGGMTVMYLMNPGFYMEEVHVYVGADPVPTAVGGPDDGKPTVAPGRYSYVQDTEPVGDCLILHGGLDGLPVYLIAHAVVCSTN